MQKNAWQEGFCWLVQFWKYVMRHFMLTEEREHNPGMVVKRVFAFVGSVLSLLLSSSHHSHYTLHLWLYVRHLHDYLIPIKVMSPFSILHVHCFDYMPSFNYDIFCFDLVQGHPILRVLINDNQTYNINESLFLKQEKQSGMIHKRPLNSICHLIEQFFFRFV